MEFNHKDYKDRNESLFSGESLLNVPATTTVLKVMLNITREMQNVLNDIKGNSSISNRCARLFAVEAVMLNQVEIILYTAFDAPKDDIFYL